MAQIKIKDLFSSFAEGYISARDAADTFDKRWAHSFVTPNRGHVFLNLRHKAAMTAVAGEYIDKGQGDMMVDSDMTAAAQTLLGEQATHYRIYDRNLDDDRARAEQAIRRHRPQLASAPA